MDKGFFGIMPILLCCSCATIKTVDPDRDSITVEYNGASSYCKSIPRVYSGVSYNVCRMFGEPNHMSAGPSRGVPVIVYDTALSAVADTVVLPYTIFLQVDKGSMKVQ